MYKMLFNYINKISIAQTADGKYVIIQNSGAMSIPLKLVGQRGNIIQIKKPGTHNSSDESPVSPQPVKRIFVKGNFKEIFSLFTNIN